MRRVLLVAVVLGIAQRELAAQCRVGTDSNEGKLLAFYTAPIVFSMATARNASCNPSAVSSLMA